MVSHRHGKGRVVTVGCPLDESCLMGLVDELAAEVDVAPLVKAAPGVMACPRVDASGNLAGLGLVNTTKDPQPVVCPQAGTDLFTGEPAGAELTLPPLGVQIIQYG